MDLDTFFVSCERLINSSLNGLPVIIGGKDRGVVSSCSYEARHFGVRSAMPMRMAMKLCPNAKVVRGDMDLYSKKSKEITEILKEDSPVLEKASIDEFYIDISGMDKFFGSYKWTSELSDRVIKESGLPISFGLSVNKCVAKIATGEGKPLGKLHIENNEVKPFLNPLSIRKIPMLGKQTYQILSRIGVRKIETLSEMPVEMMDELFGKNGISLWKKANGIDTTQVKPYSEKKSISTERTFQSDTINIDYIKSLLIKMVEKLGFELRQSGKLTSTITIKIRYSNFDTHTQQKKIPYTSADHIINQVAKELFDKVYQRRMLIRLVGIKFSGLVQGNYQINLFEDSTKMISLYQAMDRMKSKYGTGSISNAASLIR